jgi:GDP-mannose transporter
MVSATTYTLVGVVNKFLTVLLNVMVWDKHSTPMGLIAVCVCLGSGALYQQAPRRDDGHKQLEDSNRLAAAELTALSNEDDEKTLLIDANLKK